MFVEAKTVPISLKETRMQSRIVPLTTKVEKNQKNFKLTVRLSKIMDAVSGMRSRK